MGLSIILHISRQANRIVVKRWIFDSGTVLPREAAPPATLAAGDLVVLVPYGSLFFAAAPVFEKQLPEIPTRCERAVVVIRLRGKEDLGSTFIRTLESYARKLSEAGGTLLLSGLSQRAFEQFVTTGAISALGREHIFLAREHVGESLSEAIAFAEVWQRS